MKYAENLEFSPDRDLPKFAPLGGINRARKAVYVAPSKLRHDKNGVKTSRIRPRMPTRSAAPNRPPN